MFTRFIALTCALSIVGCVAADETDMSTTGTEVTHALKDGIMPAVAEQMAIPHVTRAPCTECEANKPLDLKHFIEDNESKKEDCHE